MVSYKSGAQFKKKEVKGMKKFIFWEAVMAIVSLGTFFTVSGLIPGDNYTATIAGAVAVGAGASAVVAIAAGVIAVVASVVAAADAAVVVATAVVAALATGAVAGADVVVASAAAGGVVGAVVAAAVVVALATTGVIATDAVGLAGADVAVYHIFGSIQASKKWIKISLIVEGLIILGVMIATSYLRLSF